MNQDLLASVDDGIATLTMNRPDSRNALSRDMVLDMHAALTAHAIDPAVRDELNDFVERRKREGGAPTDF